MGHQLIEREGARTDLGDGQVDEYCVNRAQCNENDTEACKEKMCHERSPVHIDGAEAGNKEDNETNQQQQIGNVDEQHDETHMQPTSEDCSTFTAGAYDYWHEIEV